MLQQVGVNINRPKYKVRNSKKCNLAKKKKEKRNSKKCSYELVWTLKTLSNALIQQDDFVVSNFYVWQ